MKAIRNAVCAIGAMTAVAFAAPAFADRGDYDSPRHGYRQHHAKKVVVGKRYMPSERRHFARARDERRHFTPSRFERRHNRFERNRFERRHFGHRPVVVERVVESSPSIVINASPYPSSYPSYETSAPASGMGTIAGAVAGAVIGSRFGEGNGKVASIAVGSVVGGYVGGRLAD